MNGPDHYKAAEQLVEGAFDYDHPEWVQQRLLAAQVHATLAQVAMARDCATRFLGEWDEVLS